MSTVTLACRHCGSASAAAPHGLAKKAQGLPPLRQTLLPAQPQEALELDELWSFVLRKADKPWDQRSELLALCRRTRQVAAYRIGRPGGRRRRPQ